MMQEQAPVMKESRVQRFMRSTSKFQVFLGPASRLEGDIDEKIELRRAEEEYVKSHWEEYVSEDGRRYLIDKA